MLGCSAKVEGGKEDAKTPRMQAAAHVQGTVLPEGRVSASMHVQRVIGQTKLKDVRRPPHTLKGLMVIAGDPLQLLGGAWRNGFSSGRKIACVPFGRHVVKV